MSAFLLFFLPLLCFPPGCNGRSRQDSKLEPHHQQKTDFIDFAVTSTSQILLQNIFKFVALHFIWPISYHSWVCRYLNFLWEKVLAGCERRAWVLSLTWPTHFSFKFFSEESIPAHFKITNTTLSRSERVFTTNFWFQNRIGIDFFQCREVIESDVFSTLMKASSYGCSMSDIWSCFLSHIMELVSNQNSKNISRSMCWNWFEFVSVVMDPILFLTTSWSRLTK